MNEHLLTLTEQLQHPDRTIRSSAALAIGNAANADALDALLARVGVEPELLVREDITWALVRLGDQAIAPLIGLLENADPAVRHHAAHTLGKLHDARAVDGLVRLLNDAEDYVVVKAVFALGQISDARAVPALVALMGDARREVQSEVNNVLEQFGAPALPLLVEAAAHERWQVREQAADVMGLIGSEESVPALDAMLRDAIWQVRFAAVTALGHIGGAAVREAIAAVSEDDEPRVRELAATVIKRMKVR